MAIEIKSSKTIHQEMLKELMYFQKISATEKLYLIHGGEKTAHYNLIKVLPWFEINSITK